MPPVPPRKVVIPDDVSEEPVLVQRPQPKVLEPQWDLPVPGSDGYETRLIHVFSTNSCTTTVKARCIGNVAVHKGLLKDQGWAVTHIPIQLSLVNLKTEQDALKVGRYFHTNQPQMMQQKTINGVLAKTPNWVKVWCREMREQKKWLDPKNYHEDE